MRATAEMQKQLNATILGEERDSQYWVVGKVDVAHNYLDSTYVVHSGKKLVDGTALNLCAVTARRLPPTLLKAEVEKAYRVKRLLDETQGLSRITAIPSI
jgi:hypothetical protein